MRQISLDSVLPYGYEILLVSQQMSFRVFCDFDGTVCSQDTGVMVIDNATQSTRVKLETDVMEKKKTYRDAVTTMWEQVKTPLDKASELLRSVDLDIGTSKLREFLSKRDLPLYILSNGLDVLIEPILTYHTKVNVRNNTCVQDIYLLANYGFPRPQGWEVVWRHDSECGHDKAVTIEQYLLEGETAVFVGDGLSDIGSVESLLKKPFPLVIFAKQGKALETFCKKNKIAHHSFKTLVDVVTELEKIDFTKKRKASGETSAPVKKAKIEKPVDAAAAKVDKKEPASNASRKAKRTDSKSTESAKVDIAKPVKTESPKSPKAKVVKKTAANGTDAAAYKVGDHALVYVGNEGEHSKCVISKVTDGKYECVDVDEEEPFKTLIVDESGIKPFLKKAQSKQLTVGQQVLAIWPETSTAYPAEVVKILKTKVQVKADGEIVSIAFSDVCLQVE